MSDDQVSESSSREGENQLQDLPIPKELLDDIPEERRSKLRQYAQEVVHIEHTSGHLPPPSMLAAYRPEVQQVIVEEFVAHRQHRNQLEQNFIQATIRQDRLSLALGFVLALSLVLCGTAVILAGYSAAGLALIAADAVAIAGIYIHDRRSSDD